MNAMDFGFDEEDDLSSALGTETLAARDMVPEGFDNTPRARVPTEQLIQGRRYLKVDQSANKRNGSKVSKIWQHGSELRALDTPNLEKHWLCNLCLPAKRLYMVSGGGGNGWQLHSSHFGHKLYTFKGMRGMDTMELSGKLFLRWSIF